MEQLNLILFSVVSVVTAAGFLVIIIFLFYAYSEMKQTGAALRQFLQNTDERLKPVLEEAERSLKHINRVGADIETAADNIRGLSDAVYDVVANVRAISGVINDFKEGISVRSFAVKTGIRTAIEVLAREFSERRR
ncbi:MAG: DUF948 domain-containing protein [Nitrospirae bacterium]|nr:DUF948 domain-containing protein [Nitrospirota bacterium]